MNDNKFNRDKYPYQAHRSDRNRDSERRDNWRFDDYGSPARGGYGNESRMGTFGNQGNEMGGSRDRGNSSTYSSSQNYGSMGSYGGAQGFDTSRGYSSQYKQDADMRHSFESGMGPMSGLSRNATTRPGDRGHGYESDFDSYGGDSSVRDVSYTKNRDVYGSDTSRRFEGADQDRYHFNMDNYPRSGNYGSSEENYMGSRDNRTSRPGTYGRMSGNYNSRGSYSQERFNLQSDRNRNYRGGQGDGYRRNWDDGDNERY